MATDLRISRYAVTSDDVYLTQDGRPCRIVYVTRTARAIAVTRAVGDALAAGTVPPVAERALTELRDAGVLVEAGRDEAAEVIDRQRAAARDMTSRQYVLLPTSYCNMGCSYCGQTHAKAPLQRNHRAAMVQRVIRGIRHPETTSVNVRWFGAEPMMAFAVIRDMSRTIIAAADEAGVAYRSSMTTNGSLLDLRRLRALHDECRVHSLCITLDGADDEHDRHRPLKSGQSSYARIVAAIREAVTNPDLPHFTVVIRTNVDVRNRDGIERFADAMVAAGLAHPRVSFALHAVYRWSNDVSGIRIEQRDFAAYEAQLLRQFIQRGLRTGLLPTAPVDVTCAAVTPGTEVHSPTGRIFSCTEHPLVEQHEQADALALLDELPPDAPRPAGRYDGWHDTVAKGGVPCHDCPVLPVCGGACPKHWDEDDPPCPSFKFNLQDRLRLLADSRGMTMLARSA
jgi:uncharacterized protein